MIYLKKGGVTYASKGTSAKGDTSALIKYFPIRLDHEDIQHIKNLAKKKGLTQGTLARLWIKERL